ncbi:MAG: hypothetical protein AAFZ01_06625 [Pseudomonadota bacterium]
MATFLDLYAATRTAPNALNVNDARMMAARSNGYTDAGIRTLVTSIFSATR